MTAFRRIAVLPGTGLTPAGLDQLRTLSIEEPIVLAAAAAGVNASEAGSVEALLCGWADRVTAAVLDAFPRLAYLGVRGTSTHRIDMNHAAARGIEVQPIYRYGDIGTAEFVVWQLLGWARSGQPRRELAVRNLGLIGYGNVACRVATVADALAMRVSFFTPHERVAPPATWTPIELLLTNSDAVSFHTPAYHPVVTADQLRLIQPEALVVATTLGLPFLPEDFVAWQSNRPGPVVLDRCAIQDAPAAVLAVPGVTVVDEFAARTAESVGRAERALLAGLRRAAPSRSHGA